MGNMGNSRIYPRYNRCKKNSTHNRPNFFSKYVKLNYINSRFSLIFSLNNGKSSASFRIENGQWPMAIAEKMIILFNELMFWQF